MGVAQHQRKSPTGYKAAAKIRDARAGLTRIERDVLSICEKAAEDGRPLESVEDMMDRLGLAGHSTVPGIMRRLEDKGYITRNVYQRGRQVCIVETGKCTVPPPCTAPHWRLRPKTDPVPTPAIHIVRQSPPIAQQIEAEARRLGKPMSEFLADLVFNGFQLWLEQGEAA